MGERPPSPEDADVDETSVRVQLRSRPATLPLAGGVLTRVEGGLSNFAWKLETAGAAWFVRLGRPDAARLGVDRASECALLGAASRAGIAPEVLACEPATGLLVTRFVEGRPWAAEDAQNDENLRRLAERLRLLHALPVASGVAEVSYAEQARRLAQDLPEPTARDEVLRERAIRAFALIEARHRPPAMCHHDLHHLNILDDGRLWLVDWEYGGRGDPLYDVAGFLTLHGLGPAPTATFLGSYGLLAPADLAVLDAARWAFDYVQWLWYRRRFPSDAEAEGGSAWRLAQRLLHCDNPSVDRDQG